LTDVFQEIDDELRQDRASRLWKMYGKYLVALAVCIVAAVAGYRFYQQKNQETREQASHLYETAISKAKSGDVRGAIEILGDPIIKDSDGYAMLSRMQQANLARRNGDYEAVLMTFKGISVDEANPRYIRDLALFNYLATEYKQTSNVKDPDKLDSLIKSGSAWKFLALELKGLIALDREKNDSAKEIFSELVDDKSTPKGIRARATELLKILP